MTTVIRYPDVYALARMHGDVTYEHIGNYHVYTLRDGWLDWPVEPEENTNSEGGRSSTFASTLSGSRGPCQQSADRA